MELRDITAADAAWIKTSLISQGVQFDMLFLDWFSEQRSLVQRRNFYNSPGIGKNNLAATPQEIFLHKDVVVAANPYGKETWKLCLNEGKPHLENTVEDFTVRVELPIDLKLFSERPDLRNSCNLYGGSALSFFSPRTCYFFSDQVPCAFCSLDQTARENRVYKGIIDQDEVFDAVSNAMRHDPNRITQIMIVGGNMRDLDKGFNHHVDLALAASSALEEHRKNSDVSVHIATMPPETLCLIDRLKEFPNVHVMFNLEVWGRSSFDRIAPGKSRDYGREKMIKALEYLVASIGEYRAHSLLVTGLEDVDITISGYRALADMGVSPISNCYHSDKASQLGLTERPTPHYYRKIAEGLANLYAQYPIQPYWHGCGRNSLDHEASLGLFSSGE